jgi:hypothetical protein
MDGKVRRPLVLMPDYHCHPIWWDTSHPDCTEMGNIDPAGLGLSAGLVADLERWALAFDAGLNWDDPGATLTDEAAEAAFRARGAELCRRLAEELGDSAVVRYFYA